MGESLAVSGQQVQWLLSAFPKGFCPSQLLYGPLSDRYGRRPVLLSGLCWRVGVLICLIGHDSLAAILDRRLLQADRGRRCLRHSQGQSAGSVQGARLRQVMSHFGTMMALFPTWPLAGGLLTERCGWLSLFIAMAGYLVLLVLLVGWRFAETHTAVAWVRAPGTYWKRTGSCWPTAIFAATRGLSGSSMVWGSSASRSSLHHAAATGGR